MHFFVSLVGAATANVVAMVKSGAEMSEDASKCEVFVCRSLVRSGSEMSDDASKYKVFIW